MRRNGATERRQYGRHPGDKVALLDPVFQMRFLKKRKKKKKILSFYLAAADAAGQTWSIRLAVWQG